MSALSTLLLFCAIAPLAVVAGEAPWPMPDWPAATPEAMGMDAAPLQAARDYALKGDGSGILVLQGRAVMAWGDQRQRYDLKSTTKSFGSS